MKTNNTYLHFVAYKMLGMWDVKRYGFEGRTFPNAVRLRDVLRPFDKPISTEVLLKHNWAIISKINFSGELFLREINDAKTFKGKLHIVDGDTLIYSKINVRHGCIYYHSNGEIPFAVSSEYPAYKLDTTRIIGSYLVKILQSSYFKKALGVKATGISKARVKPDEFLDIQIPLPSLAEQQALVDAYGLQTSNATSQEKRVRELEQNIDDTLLNMLQVNQHVSLRCFTPNQHKGYSFLEFYHFKELNRWDLYTQKSSSRSTIYPHVTFSKVMIDKPMYGAGYKSKKSPDEIRYIRITDINEDGSLNDDFVSAEQYDDKYLLKPKDFLIARSGNTVGKTFLYDERIGKAIFAGYLIRFRFDETQVNLEYLLAYTKCSIFKQWIANNMRVSGQPNINSQQYMDASLILPPMEIQQQIAEKVRIYRQEIAKCKATAATLRQEAVAQFEQAIFE